MKNRYLLLIWITIITGIIVFAYYAKIPYRIYSRGVVMPAEEFSLRKSGNGTLVSVYKNYLRNITKNIGITEFQRGDLAIIKIHSQILDEDYIRAGDTIAVIFSSEENRRYSELLAELIVQKSLLNVYSTGDKPEAVKMAFEAIIKAEQEYETQSKLTERSRVLFEKGYIPLEEYELSVNQYQIKKQNLNIARLNHDVVSTGAKQEQLNFIMATIRALELQIEQVEERLGAFNILSPISGIIIERRSLQNTDETFVNIADVSKLIVLLPVDIHQLAYIEPGHKAILKMGSYGLSFSANILSIDNVVQMIGQQQKVFITAEVDDNDTAILPGMVVDATIQCGKVTSLEYLKRLFRIVYAN
jgi:hypothetical protein